MKKIFEDLDKTLKSMGAKKLTKKEAQFVLNTLLAAMPPNGKYYYTNNNINSTVGNKGRAGIYFFLTVCLNYT